jgi:lia operon protein LiaG
MKTKTFSFITIILFLTAGFLSAKEYKVTVQNSKDVKLVLKDFSGALPIEGYDGTEIIVTTEAESFEPPAKAKGLKAIYPAGSDNTGIGLDVNKEGNIVTITCLIPFTKKVDYKIKVPENLSIEISSGCERNNDISILNTKNEIDIKTCHDIDLKNVTGPLVLSTISGNINVTFSSIPSDMPFSVNSISGDIDITLPVKTPTTLELKSISGGIYSDFDFPVAEKTLKRIGGNNLSFPLNGGGFKFSIQAISGNIYLRKGN